MEASAAAGAEEAAGDALPRGPADDGGLAGPELGQPAALPEEAYPRDEPMQSDMSDYRQALQPNLSLEDRHLLNAVREDRMNLAADAGLLARCQRLASGMADLWLRIYAELEKVAMEAAEQEAAEEAKPKDEAAEGAGPKPRAARRPAMALSVLRTAVGWDGLVRTTAPAAMQFLEQHMATLNIVMWICLLEMLHKVAGWFACLGWPSFTAALQGLTAPFLLRCYYALVARLSGPDVRSPVLQSLRTMGVSGMSGFVRPGARRPPVFHMILVARVIMLLQAVYLSWVVALQDSWGARLLGLAEQPEASLGGRAAAGR